MYSYTDSVVTTELCYKSSCLYKLHVIMFMTFDRFPSAYYRRRQNDACIERVSDWIQIVQLDDSPNLLIRTRVQGLERLVTRAPAAAAGGSSSHTVSLVDQLESCVSPSTLSSHHPSVQL